jgi:hypothetical protein
MEIFSWALVFWTYLAIPVKMTTPNQNTSSENELPLHEAEARLARVATNYNRTGKEQFGALMEVCATIAVLKAIFMKTPRKKRPVKAWGKYVEVLSARYGLGFSSGRMGNYCVELDRDVKKIGFAKVEQLVTDGGFNAVRELVRELLGKPSRKAPSVESLLQRAYKAVCAAEPQVPHEIEIHHGRVQLGLKFMLRHFKEQKIHHIPPHEVAHICGPDGAWRPDRSPEALKKQLARIAVNAPRAA